MRSYLATGLPAPETLTANVRVFPRSASAIFPTSNCLTTSELHARTPRPSPVRGSCVPGQRELRPGSAKCAGTCDARTSQRPITVPGPREKCGPGTQKPRTCDGKATDRGRNDCGPGTVRLRTGDKNPTPSPVRRRSWYPPSRLPSPAPRPQKTQTCGGGCPAPSYRTFSSHPTPRTPGASR